MALPKMTWDQFLLSKGLLKPEQLDEAKKVSQQTGQALDKVIVQLNFAGEREVMMGKAQEMGLGFADLDRHSPEPTALNIVPERIIKNHSVLPIKKDGNVLYVATSDPNNIMALDDVKMASGLRVIPVLALRPAIDEAIRKHFESSDSTPATATPSAPSAAASAAPSAMGSDVRRLMAEAQVGRGSDDDDVAGGGDDEKMADQAPIIRLANAIIQQAIADRSSDIHIEPQHRSVRIRYRVDGVLAEAMTVPKNLQAALISRFKIMAEMNIAERRVPQDGRIEVRSQNKDYDMRVSSVPTPFGEKIVMRILDKSSVMLGLDKLMFTDENLLRIEELVSQPNGMFLCTGPTGSGKTTTQYSVLNKLNTVGVNILTVEDPVEYQLNGITQVQVNRKAGLTFATALRAFLRQDPDIIMVGEMRDLETAEIAIESSLTGHLVLSTLHTNDAPSATLRLVDMGVEPYLIAATVIGVLAQRLSRRIDPESKESYQVPAIDLRRFGMELSDPDEMVTLYRGVPAERNKMTGYRGRLGIHELMCMNAEIAELVVRRAPLADIKAAAKANGMKELREDGLVKVLQGVTDPAEIMRVVFTAGY